MLPVALPEAAELDAVPEAEPELLTAAAELPLPPAEVVLSILVSTQAHNQRHIQDSRNGRGSAASGRCAAGAGSSLRRGTNRSSALRHGGVDAAGTRAGRDSLQIGESGGTSAVLEDGRAEAVHE